MPMDLSPLKKQWAKGKKYWLNKIPKLIYEYPEKVNFTISPEGKKQLFEGFRNMSILDDYPAMDSFLGKIEPDEFFTNHLKSDCEVFDDVNMKYITIPKGTKIVKAFKYFNLSEDDLKELQSMASRIIQKDIISGTLCISIHPLDYLSSSENVSNWRSCHSLDGVYRTGNLSYMGDSSTLVCYLRSDGLTKLPNFPESISWNNKKWRMLLHIDSSHQIIMTGRQYPFESETIFEYISKTLNYIFQGTLTRWSRFSKDYIRETKSGQKLPWALVPLGTTAMSISEIVEQDMYSYAYPDLLYSANTKYTSWWSIGRNYLWDSSIEPAYWSIPMNKIKKIKLGSKAYCLCCGQHRACDSDVMLCSDCVEEYQPDIVEQKMKEGAW